VELNNWVTVALSISNVPACAIDAVAVKAIAAVIDFIDFI